ncbi:MAG: hypothetical protein JXB15_11065 [Anaerolineales bacterium]|nr:hypothetical protein [Anaerolineales bacterium]
MRINRILFLVLVWAVVSCACDYIVLPEEEDTSKADASKDWSAVVTSISQTGAGDLHVDLAIRNETGDWSTMLAAVDKPAVLSVGGKTTNCDTVFVSSGGHRLAPGFQMRGFVTGTKADPKIQLLYVECKGVQAAPGARLSIDYAYFTGEYNYYEQQANKKNAVMVVDLDQIASDLQYPIAEPVQDLIQASDVEIIAINNCTLILTEITRSEKGLQFKWVNSNPGEYPTYVHIGLPPVIGADGIIYGFYESPDIASVPVTGAGKTAEWTTEVAVPPEVKGLYILLSVESKKQRLFTNYAIDISDR